MESRELVIRNATQDDVNLLAALSARTFKSAYNNMLPEDALDDFVASTFSLGSIREELNDLTNKFLLAFAKSELVGYAMLREGELPKGVFGFRPVELARVYLDEAVIGRGYGSALMQACFQVAKDDNFGTIWLGVWKQNERAIRFYEKWGFKIVGSQAFEFGDEIHTDLVMVRPTL